MSKIPKITDIPEEERTPLVVHLLEVVRYQSELIQRLRDEIAILKGDKPKPNIKPSGMEKGEKKNNGSSDSKRPGSSKRSKTKELEIHEVISVSPENIPDGSLFKGHKEFAVQGIIIQPHNIVYRLVLITLFLLLMHPITVTSLNLLRTYSKVILFLRI